MTLNLPYAGISLAINIFEYYILNIFFQQYLSVRKRNVRMLYSVIFVLVLNGVNLLQDPVLNGLTVSILIFGCALLCYDGHIIQLFAFSAIYIAISSMSEMLVSFVISIISSIPVTLTITRTATFALAGIAGKILTFAMISIIIARYPPYFDLDRSRDLLLLSLFPATAVVTMHVILRFESRLQLSVIRHILTIMLLIFFLALCVLIFFVYTSTMHKKQLENEFQLNKEIKTIGEKIFRNQIAEFESMNKLQHEFKRHMRTILDCAKSGKYEKIDEYCTQIEEYLYAIPLTHPVDFENYILSTLYARLQYECDKLQIHLTSDIRFRHFGYLSGIHANMIFGNLFDNAINACSLVESPQRKITFATYRVNSYIMILLTNSKCHDIKLSLQGLPLSTHREYRSVGYGITNILETAELYGGYFSYKYTDTEFKASVRLGTAPKSI